MFLIQIFAISALGAIYGLEYWRQVDHPHNGRKLRLFYGLMTAGMAILVVSSDLEEVMAISDRIVVMAAGRIVRTCAAQDTSIAQLVRDFGAAVTA